MKKILLIQTAFLGDVILATPVIEKLHKHYPDASIDFLLRNGNQSLLIGHPKLNRVLIFNKKEKYKSLRFLIKEIRKERYDLVVNMQRFATSGLMTALSKGKTTIGFDKNPLSRFFSLRKPHLIFKHDKGTKEYKHEVERNLSLVSHLTDESMVRQKLYPSEDLPFEPAAEYICMAPASVWFTKQFPKEKWVELIQSLDDKYQVYLLGAPSDVDLCEEIATNSASTKIKVLAGKLSLLESARLMRDAVMNYVNDSAPMHLASAMNAPVTAIFCSTIPEYGFGPISDNAHIAQIQTPLGCRPCGLHGKKECPEGHFKCGEILTSSLIKVLI